MNCQNCKKNIATSLVSCKNGQGYSYTIALCDECRKHFGKINQAVLQCPRCGAELSDLISGNAQFCPECYSSFGEALSDYLIRIHGSAIHKGKRPRDSVRNTESETEKERVASNKMIEELKSDLDSAIHEERYEDAAHIRDEIRKLQGVGDNGK